MVRAESGRGRSAAAALAAAGVAVASLVGPVAPQLSGAAAVEWAARLLADADAVVGLADPAGLAGTAGVPLNLLQDIVNIPAVEVQALDVLAKSFLFTGSWLTQSATNLWGTDPGDPSHYMALADLLIPFPQISGIYEPEIDPAADAVGTAGLGQQLALNAAATLPVNASSDADWSSPVIPTTPITGFTPVDLLIWLVSVLTHAQQLPLIDNWHTVQRDVLTGGYTFDSNDPGIVNPSSGVGQPFDGGTIGRVPAGFGFPGTIDGGTVDGTTAGQSLMPWAGTTFQLNPSGPLQNFVDSLQAAPDMSIHLGLPADSAVDAADGSATGVPTALTGFVLPSPIDIVRALQAVVAGLIVDFDPFVKGSPFCPQLCAQVIPQPKDVLGILSLGNPYIDEWVKLANTPTTDEYGLANPTGLANGITGHQAQFSEIFLSLQHLLFDFGNPSPEKLPDGADAGAPHGVVESPLPDGAIQESPLLSGLADFFAPARNALEHLVEGLGIYTPVDFTPDGYNDALDSSSLLGLLSTIL